MNNIPPIMDPSHSFYSGMTISEAKAKGLDKSFWRRDFSNIDKNKDGKLSINEIMKERNTILKRRKIGAACWGALAVSDMIVPESRFWKGLDLLLDVAFAASDIHSISKIKKESAEYDKIIAKYNLNINA